MSAITEPILTVDDLDLMPDDGNRYELLEGEIYVSRAPSLTHQRILGNLLTLLKNYLDQHPHGEAFATPGVIFDPSNGVIPDIVFISNQLGDRLGASERITEAPELVIEIISPGKENARRDRVVKRRVYAKHGVKEYWIIDPEAETLEIYRAERHKLAHTVTLQDEDVIATPLLPGFTCAVSKIFGKR
ncbi:MAG: Uma2 family endonuclease [Acidobacteriota bacterium]|nr:Uma2 family endonuclease [Acidobacteriota bacterium]